MWAGCGRSGCGGEGIVEVRRTKDLGAEEVKRQRWPRVARDLFLHIYQHWVFLMRNATSPFDQDIHHHEKYPTLRACLGSLPRSRDVRFGGGGTRVNFKHAF